MRLLSQFVRASLKAGAILLVLLSAASTAEAARRPAARRSTPATRRASCDPQKTTLKQFKRTPHNFGGPVALPSQRALVGLTDPTTRITRATETDSDDNSAAIQNDAPAAGVEVDARGVPMLRPIGLLARPIAARPCAPTCSPKSPRGPPLPA